MSFKTATMMREITQESIMSDVENILQEMEACAKQGAFTERSNTWTFYL